jgi:hypothetical protein
MSTEKEEGNDEMRGIIAAVTIGSQLRTKNATYHNRFGCFFWSNDVSN